MNNHDGMAAAAKARIALGERTAFSVLYLVHEMRYTPLEAASLIGCNVTCVYRHLQDFKRMADDKALKRLKRRAFIILH